MDDFRLLDQPMWNSLITSHAQFAIGDGLARTYIPSIGPLTGLAEQTPAAYADLHRFIEPESAQALFLLDPYIPRAGWTLIRGGLIDQMVLTRSSVDELPQPEGMRLLTAADAPAMVELAQLTEPGPFRIRTHELGTFYGIFDGKRLLAMAGQRMRVPGFVEVSAVCTHPDARGRGYARTLMSAVMQLILEAGDTPFLHVFSDNPAIRIYQSLGYVKRRTFHLAVIKRD
jgi:GNAT superfamily N-acetyltransferase